MWLAPTLTGAFAVSPPLTNGVIVNRSSVAGNAVWSGRTIGGKRSLAGILAHESCHEMERRHLGLVAYESKPTWLREGYCDYVAQESSLSEVDYARLKARHSNHPVLPYFEGRRRVAATLSANRGNVDTLFAVN